MTDRNVGAVEFDSQSPLTGTDGLQLLGELQLALVGGGIGTVTVA